MSDNHVDVLIVGAGISGIGVACHLTREVPDKSFLVLERRQAIGGTWDLFKYPGIRSDSDMFTFGYEFRPWKDTRVLADGPSIKRYVEETADEYGVTEKIRFGRKVTSASWSTEKGLWTVETVDETTGKTETYTAQFVSCCTGYYNYDQGYKPEFPGEDQFKGQIIHPQHWPKDLDYQGKRVVVIGSGATAITLVPAMAADAAHVTMLQRSPTYIVSLPGIDPISKNLKRLGVPDSVIYKLGRTRNIALQRASYDASRQQPTVMKQVFRKLIARQLKGKVDLKHFTPDYNPWDQRLCVVPDGDLFKALRRGEASIVTDQIETFTANGIKLKSGEEIEADIIVSATGLQLQLAGGAQVDVDGEQIVTRDKLFYKGVLLNDIPNAMFMLGYTNASWTLKVDMVARYFTRLLKHMDAKGYSQVVAHADPEDKAEESAMGDALKSGYIKRADHVIPRQGKRAPWKMLDHVYKDVFLLRQGGIADDVLKFTKADVTSKNQKSQAA